MNLRSTCIATRLGAGFFIILGLLAIVAGSTAYLVNENRKTLKAGMDRANLKSELVVDMKSALLQSGIAMRNMLDIATVDKQKARVDIQKQLYMDTLDRLIAAGLSAEETQILAELEAMERRIEPQYRVAIHQAET